MKRFRGTGRLFDKMNSFVDKMGNFIDKALELIENFIIREESFLQELIYIVASILTGILMGVLLSKGKGPTLSAEATSILSVVIALVAMPICQNAVHIGDRINAFFASRLSQPQNLEEKVSKSEGILNAGTLMFFAGIGLSAVKPEHDYILIIAFALQAFVLVAVIHWVVHKIKKLSMSIKDE